MLGSSQKDADEPSCIHQEPLLGSSQDTDTEEDDDVEIDAPPGVERNLEESFNETTGLLAELRGECPQRRAYPRISLHIKGRRTTLEEVKGFVDSMASHSFISEDLVTKLGLATNQDLPSRRFEVGVGEGFTARPCKLHFTVYAHEGQEIKPIEMKLDCFVAQLNQVDLILGQNWCEANNACIQFNPEREPRISIADGRFLKMDEGCSARKLIEREVLQTNTLLTIVSPVGNFKEALSGTRPVEMTDDQKDQLDQLLEKYKDVFVPHQYPPKERVPGESVHIRLKEGSVAKSTPSYPLSPEGREEGRKIVEDLLARGFLTEGSSEWGSPLLVVAKKDVDGQIYGYRAVWDFRYLNSQTIRDNFPLPLIEDCLHKLARFSMYSGSDGDDGFGQMPLNEDSQRKCCVTTPWGSFFWKVLPQGVSNGPSNFQSMMQRIFHEYSLWLIVFIDDLAIGANSIEEMFSRLTLFFERCRKENIRLKWKKTFLFQRVVRFLGHEIEKGKIRPLQKHIVKMQEWPIPRTRGQVSSFVGLLNFYRKFISRFAEIAGPLYQYTATTKQKSKESIELSSEALESFDLLKKKMGEALELVSFDRSCPHRLRTDANYSTGSGACLEQYSDGDWRPIYFFSKKHSPSTLNYTVQEKEFLSIINGLTAFAHLLLGTEFYIETDSQNAVYFFSKHSSQLSGREKRWLEYIAQFTPFDIRHIKGTLNVTADFLSRENSAISGSDIIISDCYAGSPTLLRALEKWWLEIGQERKVTSIEYQAIERSEESRKAIGRVHSQMLERGIPLTPDPFILSRHVEHDMDKVSNKFEMHRKLLRESDFQLLGPPCQPWSKASRKPLGSLDHRDGFPNILRMKEEGLLGKKYVLETVPSDLEPNLRAFGDPKEFTLGAQTRRRMIYSNMILTQEPEISKQPWQDALDKAGKNGIAPRPYSPTLMVKRYTHSERSKDGQVPYAWVLEGDVYRSMAIEERETLCGLHPGDTNPKNSITSRRRMTGNAIPVSSIFHWLETALENCFGIPSTNEARDELTIEPTHYLLTSEDEILSKIRHFHETEAGHSGIETTMGLLLSSSLSWVEDLSKTELKELVKIAVKSCRHCQRYKAARVQKTKIHVLPFPLVAEPFHSIQMDDSMGWALSEEGNNSIIIIVCNLTGYIKGIPCHKNDDRRRRCKLLHNFFSAYGFPSELYVDRGSQYNNSFFELYAEIYGIKLKLGAAEHHQTQGRAERAVELVRQAILAQLEILRKETNVADTSLWEEVLPDALRFLNNKPKKGLRYLTANEAVLGRNVGPKPSQEFDELWHAWQEEVAKIAELSHKRKAARAKQKNKELGLQDPKFFVGQRVAIIIPAKERARGKKDAPFQEGPYTIKKDLLHGKFLLTDGSSSEITRHMSDLLPWIDGNASTLEIPVIRKSARQKEKRKQDSFSLIKHYVLFEKKGRATRKSGNSQDYQVHILNSNDQLEVIPWHQEPQDHCTRYLHEWGAVARGQDELPGCLQALWNIVIHRWEHHGTISRTQVQRLARKHQSKAIKTTIRKFGIEPVRQA